MRLLFERQRKNDFIIQRLLRLFSPFCAAFPATCGVYSVLYDFFGGYERGFTICVLCGLFFRFECLFSSVIHVDIPNSNDIHPFRLILNVCSGSEWFFFQNRTLNDCLIVRPVFS